MWQKCTKSEMTINNRWVSWGSWLLLLQTQTYKQNSSSHTGEMRDLILNAVRPTAWVWLSKAFPGVQLLWVGYLWRRAAWAQRVGRVGRLRPAGHPCLPQSPGVFSPNLEWPGDPQAAGLVGSVGSWLNDGVHIRCSVVFFEVVVKLCVSQEIRDR